MFVEEKNIQFTNMGGGITRRCLGNGDNIMGCIMTFKKGSYVEPHSHSENEQFILMLKGKFEITCGSEKRILTAGDCCYAAKNQIHATLCLEDDSVLLDVHTPLRMDILNDVNAVPDIGGKLF